jgi:methylglutaconyl-CoA hydratase
MPDPLVLVRRPDNLPAVVFVTLNRPDKRNALSLALIDELRAAVAAASADPSARALVLRGAGPAFCAGLDLTEAAQPGMHERSAEALAAMYEALGSSPLVTIAAPHGAAMGGGAGLVAACDFAIAADDLRLAYPEVRRGLVAALVTCLLRRQVSDRQVRELILLGQTITASQAAVLGLVRSVVGVADIERAALDLAAEILKGAPGAIARTKKLLDALSPRPLHEDLRISLDFHLAARHSPEAAEGVAAFREKRPPVWPPRAD